MKGTEKQIAWATDIKANIIKVYDGVKAADPSGAAMIDKAIEMLEAIDDAGLIINLYRSVKFDGDLMHDFSELASAHMLMTPAQQALVMPQ